MKKYALTAGELLVTMAIIGIIAVLTIPSLLQDYQNKLLTTKIKKNYNQIISNIERACSDSNVSFFNQTPYPGNPALFLQNYSNVKTTSTSHFATAYDTLGTASGDALTIPTAKKLLKSGEAIALECSSQEECTFYVDTNGLDKPNIAGRDMFSFTIDTTTNTLITDDKTKCTTSKRGEGCLQKIIDSSWKMNY